MGAIPAIEKVTEEPRSPEPELLAVLATRYANYLQGLWEHVEQFEQTCLSVLTTSVLWIALEISSCRCDVAKVFRTNIYGPLPSMQLLPTNCLSLVLLQDGPRSDLSCFLHELAVENSCCAHCSIRS